MKRSSALINRSLRFVVVVAILMCVALPDSLVAQTVGQSFWSDVDEAALTVSGPRYIVPVRYRTLRTDAGVLWNALASAPMEEAVRVINSEFIVALPMPDGHFERFKVVESPIMEPPLAAKFPEIRTYLGQGVDAPTATTRFDITPAGFHAIIFTDNGTVYIDPYSMGTTEFYVCYYKRDYRGREGQAYIEEGPVVYDPQGVDDIKRIISEGFGVYSGEQLRTYRAAVAATGEYTTFHGGTVQAGMAAIVTAMNRVDGVYEREVAVRMVLVANNNLIVYINASTDPYTNNNGSTMLGENQTNLDAVIGSANYDIGHVFSTGGGGVAYLGCVCVAGSKARGVTGSSSPIGDPFTIDYVAHEMGHQFGGNHSFNGNSGSCSGGNRNASTAYEPGSGSTIMAYAGICSPQDLQAHSDDYFHGISLDEIVAYTQSGSGSTCPTVSSTGNNAPTVSGGVTGLTIPVSTPFALTGSATDPNGDTLRYCWEEFDLGPAGAPGSPSGNAPIFRSFSPVTTPVRIFPKLSDLLNNTQTIGELLPTYGRTLTFRLTARDYRAGGGGVGKSSNVSFTVTASAGPFVVTSPNTAVTWPGGSTQTVTWNVANTNISPVSCANVKISLSTDGGQSWPHVLAASTPNDGSEAVTIPNLSSTTARVKVEAVGNIFFDVSNMNFTITSSGSATVLSPNGGEVWNIGSNQLITWSTTGVSGNVKIELSRNGGSTYEVLFASTANDGSEPWTVTSPPTTNALVRVSSVDVPSIMDVSNAPFTISPTYVLLTKLWLHDNGGVMDSLDFGASAGASDGIDPEYDEYELPPVPPSGVLDVRWAIAGTQGAKRDIRDTLGGSHQQAIYLCKLQPSEGGYPFVVKWRRSDLPSTGTFVLRDGPSGFFFNVNMRQQDSLVITDEAVVQFQLVYSVGTVTASVQNGWNIVSLPVTVTDRRKSAVYPTSTSSAYTFTPGGYVVKDTLNYGVGYWLKFPSSQTIPLAGTARITDTITVVQGWNMIGSVSTSVPVGTIIQIPSGIVGSPYYIYNGAYTVASQIDPAKGYWVKINQNGKLVLSGTSQIPIGGKK